MGRSAQYQIFNLGRIPCITWTYTEYVLLAVLPYIRDVGVWKVLCWTSSQRVTVSPIFEIKRKPICQIRSKWFYKFGNIYSIFNLLISNLLYMHCFWPASFISHPPHSARPPAKPKSNIMTVILNSAGYLLLAFLSTASSYVIQSINYNTISLYRYSKLQTLIRSLSVHLLQCIWTWRQNGIKTQ